MANDVNIGSGNGDVYDSASIKVLEGLEVVRLRPAMYIGSTGEMGLHHLVYEVVDNSVGGALGGYGTQVDVNIHLDNSVTVVDNGRGIPVDMHEEEGVSAAQVVMTKLHAGGKFDSKSYKVSGGLHGVGVSCVNALSERLELEIWRPEGDTGPSYTWQQEYACGVPKGPLQKTGKAGRKTGTRLTLNRVAGVCHLGEGGSGCAGGDRFYGQRAGVFKDQGVSRGGDDERGGLSAVISVELPQPQFEGQTKGKLNSDIQGQMVQFVNDKLGEYFDKNSAAKRKIVSKCIEASRALPAARKARDLTRRQGAPDSRGLPRNP